MSEEALLKWKLIGGAVAVVLALVAVVVKSRHMSSELVVVAPLEAEAKVVVDGSAYTVPAGKHLRIKARRGNHRVKLVDAASGQEHEVQVTLATNTQSKVVPVSSGQCFLVYDVTSYLYTSGYRPNPAATSPRLIERHLGEEAFAVPPETFFHLEDLPEKYTGKERLHVALDTPCELIGRGGEELAFHGLGG